MRALAAPSCRLRRLPPAATLATSAKPSPSPYAACLLVRHAIRLLIVYAIDGHAFFKPCYCYSLLLPRGGNACLPPSPPPPRQQAAHGGSGVGAASHCLLPPMTSGVCTGLLAMVSPRPMCEVNRCTESLNPVACLFSCPSFQWCLPIRAGRQQAAPSFRVARTIMDN